MSFREDDDDDRPPPAKSARTKPSVLQHRRALHDPNNTAVRAKRHVDPRFDPMFGSPLDNKNFEKNYKFLLEQEDEEEQKRRFRIKCLKCVLRRHEMEAARYEKKKQLLAAAGNGKLRSKLLLQRSAEEEEEDEDLSDYERDTFGEDHLDELKALKLTPPAHLYRELEQLQRETQLYISRRKNTAAVSRKEAVRKELMKKEVSAVKEGAKARPFFPKRGVVKRAVLSDKFDRLEEKGGKGAVDRYLARKTKR